jgi:predicted nucleic acid-binding protein
VNVLLDTAVLIAAIVRVHPMHERAVRWLKRVKLPTDTGIVSAHTLAELYAFLTRLPIQPRISPELARRLIHDNVLTTCQVIPLTQDDYEAVIARLAERGLVGGVTYDALILHAAVKAQVDVIVTLNEKDFTRIDPSLANKITAP